MSGWQRAAAAVLGVLVAVTAGSHVVRAVFRLTRREVRPARPGAVATDAVPPGAAAPTGEPPLDLESPASVLRGGAWIGYLERGAVAATLLASFPEGLALVLAVKGVGRYPELRDAGSGGRAGPTHPRSSSSAPWPACSGRLPRPAPPRCCADRAGDRRLPPTGATSTVSACAS